MPCVRTAWLELNEERLLLQDEDAGYFCDSLDLGYPEVRDVTSNRPDQHGIDDRTLFFGARAVSATIQAVRGAGAVIDQVAASFSRFMQPDIRPELHYILDRPGTPERMLVVRAAGYGWAVEGAEQRSIALSWVCADPYARDADLQQTIALAGAHETQAFTFPMTFPFSFTIGGDTPPSVGNMAIGGDVSIKPLLRVYGPIANASVSIRPALSSASFVIGFVGGYNIAAGQYVEIDTQEKTAFLNGDRTKSVITSIDWANVFWPVLPTGQTSYLQIRGSSTSPISQVIATWRAGYLT
jgi:hypothetical protein